MAAPELSSTVRVSGTGGTGFWAQRSIGIRSIPASAIAPRITLDSHHGIRFTFSTFEQRFKQLSHGLAMTGNNDFRSNLMKRNKDKSTLSETRVGNLQSGPADFEVA